MEERNSEGKKMEYTTFSSSPVQQFTFHFTLTLEYDDSIAKRPFFPGTMLVMKEDSFFN